MVIVPIFCCKIYVLELKSEVCLIVVMHNTHVISERVIRWKGEGNTGEERGDAFAVRFSIAEFSVPLFRFIFNHGIVGKSLRK